ncbi:hypothetical protein PIB30_003120 [Stylosanthes scabra]|uniref:Uncharacterized protein n=1 Tax=Stylosanthes scabra TaxID=79078 RepID=A0ABU6Y2T0_9FABA|nr:hypothetical protein [Stylosanthes scabra]
MEDLFNMFKDEWLPKPNALRYIYVQMKEVLHPSKETHVYLMVADLTKSKVWIFDSFPSQENAKTRIFASSVVGSTLDHILRVGFHDLGVLNGKPPMHKWEPEFVLGVPNMGNPYKDKLWILLWLQMKQYFSESAFGTPKNHIDNVQNKVRMDTGLAFVT